MSFDFDKISGILVCPQCHSDLVHDGDKLVCANSEVRLQYAIVEHIPRLLVDEAVELTPEEWAEVMTRAGRDPVTGAVTN